MTSEQYQPIVGSTRQMPPGGRRVGDAAPDAPVTVTVVLRRAADAPGTAADPADVARVEEFARSQGLTVGQVNPVARSIELIGTVEQMNAAFGVDLGEYEQQGLRYRGREGAVTVPDTVHDAIVAVLGLDERPQARAHFRVAGPAGDTHQGLVPHAAPSGYPPQEVARRYGFPTDADGSGQTVAVIELGGGFRTADLRAYFAEQRLKTPAVAAVSVDGAHNKPGGDADGEVMLDIEVIGAVAQGAAMAVYFAPNTTKGFYDAVAAAINDQHRKPSVISISWGAAETAWTAQAMDAYDALFADAGAAGITVYAAAGDDGATDRVADGGNHVDFPASSPNVVGCGGTKLTDADETVWNELAGGAGATGGGVSRHFGPAAYQAGVQVPVNPDGHAGRGVPDVAGDADPQTGYIVRVDGKDLVIGGTSAVAPLWAALTAIANQRNGKPAGAAHKALYAAPAAFRDITSGDNGGYDAAAGWDACTGLGTPRGDAVVAALSA